MHISYTENHWVITRFKMHSSKCLSIKPQTCIPIHASVSLVMEFNRPFYFLFTKLLIFSQCLCLISVCADFWECYSIFVCPHLISHESMVDNLSHVETSPLRLLCSSTWRTSLTPGSLLQMHLKGPRSTTKQCPSPSQTSKEQL